MLWREQQFSTVTRFDDPTGIHHGDTIGEFVNDAEIVGDEQDRHASLRLQIAKQPEDLGLDRHVERRGRFVGDQELWTGRQGHRDHDPLF